MATGPIDQPILGQKSRIPYSFRCYSVENPFSEFPVLPDNSGVYVFANLSHIDNMGSTIPKVLYVGHTHSYNERLTEKHEKWNDAKKLKVTHICLLDKTSEKERAVIEKDIYDKHKPQLNDKNPFRT